MGGKETYKQLQRPPLLISESGVCRGERNKSFLELPSDNSPILALFCQIEFNNI